MTPALIALGRRAVACNGWRWMPGMSFANRVDDDHHGSCERFPGEGVLAENGAAISDLSYAIPDLSDPATLGCLLALVREAYGDSTIYSEPQRDGTFAVLRLAGLYLYVVTVRLRADTEAEALVFALESIGGT